jgi:TPR repeat protein
MAVAALAVAIITTNARAELAEGVGAYERGEYERAVALLVPMAEQGDAHAQYLIGRMRFYGQAVPQDAAEAARWYRRSAERGYAPAQLALGLALDGGWGVAQAPTEAVDWYRRAAAQGMQPAMWRLAYHYRRGVGVARDLAEAWAWFDRLAAEGDTRALAERDWLALVGLDDMALIRARARSAALGRALEQGALDPAVELLPPP